MELFSSIIGHTPAKEVLGKMVAHTSLPHALLFIGSDHVGKTMVAKALCREVLGVQNLETQPDYLELKRLDDEKTGKRKSNISVRQVRDLVGRLSMTSFTGDTKVIFIEEAHKLSMGGANALLKTLEEPKGQTLFILRAPSLEDVPATIASRCQVMRFTVVAQTAIVDGLICAGFSQSDAHEAALHSEGRPGLALRFLKDSAYRAVRETDRAQAEAFLAASLPERLRLVMEFIPKGEVNSASRLQKVITELQTVARRQLLLTTSSTCPPLVSFLNRLCETRQAARHNINPHLALEHIALSI
ncbi:AAA family ATPase [Candidatus Uhrbacteria bacterium]|nr:AAA family ATPase [Candidatus Uhrbacteria bacterium]